MIKLVFLRTACGILSILTAGCVCSQTRTDSVPAPKSVLEIMSNRAIWGKDMPLALAYLESVAKTGEKRVELAPASLARSQRFANAQAANTQLTGLNAALDGANQLELFQKVQRNYTFEARTPKTELVKAIESDSLQPALTFGKVQFFKPDVNMITIQKELGAAESISYKTINGEGEALPQILTFHSYAKGAIVFVESNYSRKPRLLERVYFDVPQFVNSLKTNLK